MKNCLWLGCVVLTGIASVNLANEGSVAPVIPKSYRSGVWKVLDTANFQICCLRATPNAEQIAAKCESLRTELITKWLPAEAAGRVAAWSPRCQIILHARSQDYLATVGRGASSTVGSSEVRVDKGAVQSRRVDLRADQPNYLVGALPHELTHVVLADYFLDRALPLWADEGMAILADPAEKRHRHNRDLHAVVAGGSAKRLVDLVTQEGYPRSGEWAGFYGQSASLVGYLVSRESPAEFVRFLELAMTKGYDPALRQAYGIETVAHLEQLWRHHLAAAR